MRVQPRQGAGTQDRAVRTREQILSAAVRILVDRGYAGMTMAQVQAEAGVSRGALTHHFATMNALAAAAVDYIADLQAAEIAEVGARSADPVDLVEAIHEVTRRPTFVAGLELWVAARGEPPLRDALRPGARRLGAQLRAALGEQFGELPDDRLDLFADGLLSLLRGLAIGGVLRDRPERERAVLRAWVAAFTAD